MSEGEILIHDQDEWGEACILCRKGITDDQRITSVICHGKPFERLIHWHRECWLCLERSPGELDRMLNELENDKLMGWVHDRALLETSEEA